MLLLGGGKSAMNDVYEWTPFNHGGGGELSFCFGLFSKRIKKSGKNELFKKKNVCVANARLPYSRETGQSTLRRTRFTARVTLKRCPADCAWCPTGSCLLYCNNIRFFDLFGRWRGDVSLSELSPPNETIWPVVGFVIIIYFFFNNDNSLPRQGTWREGKKKNPRTGCGTDESIINNGGEKGRENPVTIIKKRILIEFKKKKNVMPWKPNRH